MGPNGKKGHDRVNTPACLTAAVASALLAMAHGQVALAQALPGQSKAQTEEVEVSPLVPPWEGERLSTRNVDASTLRFRPGKGLEIRSEDGAFSVILAVRAQVLYVLEDPAERPDPGKEENQDSLQIRRARVKLQGNLFGRHNTYKLELAVSPRDVAAREEAIGTAPLLDWYVHLDHLTPLAFQVGQYKVPYSRQRMISSRDLQFVDRSIVESEFNLDRDVGFDVRAPEPIAGIFTYFTGIFAGRGRNTFELQEQALLYVARVELLPLGTFDDQTVVDFERRLVPRLSLGAAYAYLKDADGIQGILGRAPLDGGTSDLHNVTTDLLVKYAGFSLLSEIMRRQAIDRDPGDAVDPETMLPIPPELPRDGWGWFAQLGYLIPRTALEIGWRYGMIRPNDIAASSLPENNELGAVVSYYAARHALKVQMDYFRLWEERGFDSGDNQLRLQFEAGF